MYRSKHLHITPTLRAVSGDATFLEELSHKAFRGKVHSVFDRVINIERDDGELFTLACLSCDNAPNTLILGIDSFHGNSSPLGSACMSCGNGSIAFSSGLIIDPTEALAWQETLPSWAENFPAPAENLSCLEQALENHGTGGGMKAMAKNETSYWLTVNRLLTARTQNVFDALRQGKTDEACRNALELIGLGPGLTPSGDDFLLGLFAVLNIENSPCHGLREVAGNVVSKASHLTNKISFTALKHASEGRVRQSIISLLKDALHGDKVSLESSLSRVLSIGSTSGTDIVSGILSGLKLNLHFAED